MSRLSRGTGFSPWAPSSWFQTAVSTTNRRTPLPTPAQMGFSRGREQKCFSKTPLRDERQETEKSLNLPAASTKNDSAPRTDGYLKKILKHYKAFLRRLDGMAFSFHRMELGHGGGASRLHLTGSGLATYSAPHPLNFVFFFLLFISVFVFSPFISSLFLLQFRCRLLFGGAFHGTRWPNHIVIR